MTAGTPARSEPVRHAFGTNWKQTLQAFLAVATIVVAIGLAILGLDALNDVLARGLSAISNPSH